MRILSKKESIFYNKQWDKKFNLKNKQSNNKLDCLKFELFAIKKVVKQ